MDETETKITKICPLFALAVLNKLPSQPLCNKCLKSFNAWVRIWEVPEVDEE